MIIGLGVRVTMRGCLEPQLMFTKIDRLWSRSSGGDHCVALIALHHLHRGLIRHAEAAREVGAVRDHPLIDPPQQRGRILVDGVPLEDWS